MSVVGSNSGFALKTDNKLQFFLEIKENCPKISKIENEHDMIPEILL